LPTRESKVDDKAKEDAAYCFVLLAGDLGKEGDAL
jgi:hypothetical protein